MYLPTTTPARHVLLLRQLLPRALCTAGAAAFLPWDLIPRGVSLQPHGQCWLQAGISIPDLPTGSRSSADPGRISPPHSVCRKITAKKGSVARGGGREEGRFLPSKANVSAAEFASALCLQEHYTTIHIIPNSTAIQRRCKEKHPQNPGRTKEGFPSAPSGNSWDKWLRPEAGEAYFIYLVWGCPWVLGNVQIGKAHV